MEEKECRKCHETKPITDFYKKKLHKNGIASQCKVCVCNYLKEYKSRKGNYNKKVCDMTPEQYENMRIKNKKAYLRRTYGVSKEEMNRFLKL